MLSFLSLWIWCYNFHTFCFYMCYKLYTKVYFALNSSLSLNDAEIAWKYFIYLPCGYHFLCCLFFLYRSLLQYHFPSTWWNIFLSYKVGSLAILSAFVYFKIIVVIIWYPFSANSSSSLLWKGIFAEYGILDWQ